MDTNRILKAANTYISWSNRDFGDTASLHDYSPRQIGPVAKRAGRWQSLAHHKKSLFQSRFRTKLNRRRHPRIPSQCWQSLAPRRRLGVLLRTSERCFLEFNQEFSSEHWKTTSPPPRIQSSEPWTGGPAPGGSKAKWNPHRTHRIRSAEPGPWPRSHARGS